MSKASKIRVGVARGGPSSKYGISLKTGAHILKNLPDKYSPVDIFIDREGNWHAHGVATAPADIFKKIDILFNATHGEYGEDGTLARLLDTFSIPYTGSRHLGCILAMNKPHSKSLLKKNGIKTPYYLTINAEDPRIKNPLDLWRSIPNPSVVKPISGNASFGVSVVKKFQELEEALANAFKYADTIMIEEYISGREAICGVIESFRREDLYAFLPAEIAPPPGRSFLDYEAKYRFTPSVFHPGRFSELEKYEMQTLSKKAHQLLGLRHYSKSDFIVSPNRGIYFLETDSLPDLHIGSPFVNSFESVGLGLSAFIGHLLDLALKKS